MRLKLGLARGPETSLFSHRSTAPVRPYIYTPGSKRALTGPALALVLRHDKKTKRTKLEDALSGAQTANTTTGL